MQLCSASVKFVCERVLPPLELYKYIFLQFFFIQTTFKKKFIVYLLKKVRV